MGSAWAMVGVGEERGTVSTASPLVLLCGPATTRSYYLLLGFPSFPTGAAAVCFGVLLIRLLIAYCIDRLLWFVHVGGLLLVARLCQCWFTALVCVGKKTLLQLGCSLDVCVGKKVLLQSNQQAEQYMRLHVC